MWNRYGDKSLSLGKHQCCHWLSRLASSWKGPKSFFQCPCMTMQALGKCPGISLRILRRQTQRCNTLAVTWLFYLFSFFASAYSILLVNVHSFCTNCKTNLMLLNTNKTGCLQVFGQPFLLGLTDSQPVAPYQRMVQQSPCDHQGARWIRLLSSSSYGEFPNANPHSTNKWQINNQTIKCSTMQDEPHTMHL